MGVLRVKVNGIWVDVGASLPPLAARNLLDNGQMAIKQRTATTQTMTPSFPFLADRWQIVNNTIGTSNLVYATAAAFSVYPPTGRPRPGSIQYIQMTAAEAAGSLAAGDYMLWQQAIEGQFLQHLNWGSATAQPLTWSADVYSAIATTYVIELFVVGATNRSISALLPLPAGFSTATVTFPGDASQVIINDNAARLTCAVWLGAGSTYASGTLNTAWNTIVNATRAAGISNAFAATNGNIFAITNAQLEIGTQATPYEVRPYDRELIKAMRYYRQTPTAPNGEGAIFGYQGASALIGYTVDHPVVMRANPTPSLGGTWTTTNASGGLGVQANGPQSYIAYTTAAALGVVQVYSNSNGYLIFNAEI